MAQIFKPSVNSLARISLLGAALLPVVLILGGSRLSRSPANTRVGLPIEQPIPFSHRHHTVELGIDCRYCHTSVENAAEAGLPSSETCMSCHSQIWENSPLLDPVRKSYEQNKPLTWVKLNKVPEFVYFNHAIHVNKGISCNHCHGKIQDMQMAYKARTLFMAWCLECHKAPEKYLTSDKKNPQLSPREQVFNLYKKYQSDIKMKDMTPNEVKLLTDVDGNGEQRADSIEEGVKLVKERGIRTEQMSDCSVCHH